MKKLFPAIAALVALTGGSASAADLAPAAPAPMYKAPAYVQPVYSWTGFYIGINGGGTWVDDHLTSSPADPGTTAFWAPCFAAGACPRDYGSASGSSAEFGGQAGYNWQINNFLVGVETDVQWTNASANAAVSLPNTGTGFVPFNGQASSKLDWFGTTRARLGFLPTPSMLLYGTGGVAYGSIARSWTANFPVTAQLVSGSDTQGAVGWAAGAGAEWMFSQHWIVGVEYLYMQFESHTFFATGNGSAGCLATNCNFNVSSGGLSANVGRVKLDYKF
jgi:outer membrane immunogenic protein